MHSAESGAYEWDFGCVAGGKKSNNGLGNLLLESFPFELSEKGLESFGINSKL